MRPIGGDRGRMTLRERIHRLYQLHPRGERAETGPRRGKAPTGLTWLAREAGVTREAVRQCLARNKASRRIEMVIRRLEYEAGLITTEELMDLYAHYPPHARPTEAELAELRAYALMAAEERRSLRERGEWPAVLAAAREELEASGWHRGTAVRALAARLRLTHRTAEEAVGEVLDAVAIQH